MSDGGLTRGRRLLTSGICLLTLALVGASLVLMALTCGMPFIQTWGMRGDTQALTVMLILIGALLTTRHPGNLIGWGYLTGGLLSGAQSLAGEWANYGLVAYPGALPGADVAAWLLAWIWVPIVGGIGVYPFLFFPDGRLLSPRWRPVAWIAATGIALMLLALMVAPNLSAPSDLAWRPPIVIDEGLANLILALGGLGIVTGAALSVAAMLVRFRRAQGVERQQFKWLLSAAVFLMIAVAVQMIVGFAVEPALGYAVKPDDYLLIAAAGFLPVATGVAILRYRLWQIDAIINRALVYGSLTGLLLAIYLGSVILLQSLFRAVTGQTHELATITATLTIAALFQPLRRRVQAGIDHRFYRRKYDAARTLASFSGRLRDEVDLPALSEELVGVVRETMQPAHVSL